MPVEYKIRFVDGAVIVTQTVRSGPRKALTTSEHVNLGTEFRPSSSQTPQIALRPTAAVRALGAGEPSPSSTGGGEPFSSGLTIVFGSVQTGGPVSTMGSGEPSPSSTGGGEPSPSSTGGGGVAS